MKFREFLAKSAFYSILGVSMFGIGSELAVINRYKPYEPLEGTRAEITFQSKPVTMEEFINERDERLMAEVPETIGDFLHRIRGEEIEKSRVLSEYHNDLRERGLEDKNYNLTEKGREHYRKEDEEFYKNNPLELDFILQ